MVHPLLKIILDLPLKRSLRPNLGSELALSRCEYKRVKAGLGGFRKIDPSRAMRVMVSLGGFRRV